jgi:hypothetical protein
MAVLLAQAIQQRTGQQVERTRQSAEDGSGQLRLNVQKPDKEWFKAKLASLAEFKENRLPVRASRYWICYVLSHFGV